MKKSLFTFLFISCSVVSFAQGGANINGTGGMTGPIARTDTRFGTQAQDIAYDRNMIRAGGEEYTINGRKVVGSVFLFPEWLNGKLTTIDGKVFGQYKLRYDAFNQAVYFLQGTQGLEVADPVRQFSLLVPVKEGIETLTFIHSDEIKKEKKPFFYEVMIDGKPGQLLKKNQKYVTDNTDGLPLYEGKKVLALSSAYFYFDKESKKVFTVKANGSNISEILNLSTEQLTALAFTTYDFSRETEIARFFQTYFATKS